MAVLLGPVALHAASPQLLYVLPPGVERGHEHVLTFTGARLADAAEVLFYEPGVTVKKLELINPQNVRVTVDVAANCRLGKHIAQLRTRSGISDYRPFFVGALPPMDEKEPNNSPEHAQPIEPGICVEGVLQNEDVDCFCLFATKGERLSIEVEGIRLGQAFIDPYLSILDEKRRELVTCDDTVLAKQDPFLSIIVPADGEYTIRLRDAAYRGAGDCRYRLHVGHFPRPTVAYPAGGKRGEKVKVQFLGDAAGLIEREIAVAADAPADDSLFVEDQHGVTPSGVPFRASGFGNVMESEPNNSFETATVTPVANALGSPGSGQGEPRALETGVGLAFNGRIEKPGDFDFFKFAGHKGDVWEIECYAQRIGSPLDPVLTVFNARKAVIKANDDARRQDSYFRWKVPAEGEYYLHVKDLFGRGGETFVYRVEMTPVTPSFKIDIPRMARYRQERQTIVVPRGNRYGTLLLATRADCSGPVELLGGKLPPGITFATRAMDPNMTLMPVVFEAAENAPLSGALVDLRAKLKETNKPPIEGGYENIADFVRGQPNNAVYVTGTVQKVAMAVSEKVPYRLEIVSPKVPLVRRGTMQLKVLVHRDAGFKAPLELNFPFTPPGVGAIHRVSVAERQNDVLYPINANAKAAIGKWPIMVIGAADIGGQAWVSSQLAELEIAESYVNIAMKRAACEQGQVAQFHCMLKHHTPFEGKAKAELVGLPPGTTAEPREFTRDTKELVIDVKTTAQTPVGRHKTLICQATITQQGEPIVSNVATSELQVFAPPTKPAKRPVAPVAAAAPPTKALSRLEQLRAKALHADVKKP